MFSHCLFCSIADVLTEVCHSEPEGKLLQRGARKTEKSRSVKDLRREGWREGWGVVTSVSASMETDHCRQNRVGSFSSSSPFLPHPLSPSFHLLCHCSTSSDQTLQRKTNSTTSDWMQHRGAAAAVGNTFSEDPEKRRTRM